jgi:Arc/MetJ-type ribon-helix-helix transcriptional regulator
MTATLSAPAESLLRERVASGEFRSVDEALDAAVRTAFGHRASPALEALLDEALQNTGRRVPLSELRQQAK